MKKRAQQPNDRRFQLAWSLLHILAAVNAAAFVMHCISALYHAQRAVITEEFIIQQSDSEGESS